MRRTLMAAAMVAVAGTLFVGAPANAGVIDYGTICQLAFTPTPPFAAGGAVVVDGTGFPANFATALLFDGQPFSPPEPVVSDAAGEFTESVTIPANATAGAHSISAVCDPNSQTPVDFPVTVLGGGIVAPTFVTDPSSINCAGQLRGNVDNAQPNSQVTFRTRLPNVVLATVQANGAGHADFTVANFATNRPTGEYEIVSSGLNQQSGAFELSTRVNLTFNSCNAVTPTTLRGGTGPSATARTGTDAAPMVAVGSGTVLAGAAFVLIARRRRATSTAMAS